MECLTDAKLGTRLPASQTLPFGGWEFHILDTKKIKNISLVILIRALIVSPFPFSA